jgi:hypothetical protein
MIYFSFYNQLLAMGWFSPASPTTKAGRHDIAEILLKVALKHQISLSLFTSIITKILSETLIY